MVLIAFVQMQKPSCHVYTHAVYAASNISTISQFSMLLQPLDGLLLPAFDIHVALDLASCFGRQQLPKRKKRFGVREEKDMLVRVLP